MNMNNLSLVLVAALSLAAAGCNKKGADCGAAIDHSMELAKADMQKRPGADDKMLQKMKDTAVQHCKDDKWPDEALECMSAASTETAAQACYGKLSREQQDKMNSAAAAKPPTP
jgi:hypothetical protein